METIQRKRRANDTSKSSVMYTLKKILISEVVNGVLSQRQLVGKQAVDLQLIEAMAKLHHL